MLICPVCNSTNTGLYMHGIFDSETTDVIDCHSCGLQFLSPLMTEVEEDAYYSGYYRKQDGRRFREMSLCDQQQQSFLHYEQYRDVYLRLLEGSRSIFEIGCGTGGFLRFLQAHRPDIRFVATERCVENADFVRQGFGDETVVDEADALNDGRFDTVLALGVFEHLRDSREFLRSIRSCLNNEGKLVLKVPNKENVLVHAYGLEEFKRFMYMKQHYYTFTERSFEVLASQTGYRVEGFHYVQAWGLDNHLSWLRHRRPRNFSDISSLLSPGTLAAYNRDLIDRKLTDTFMAVLAPVPG
jgi:SAM-dependent methyltransferase